MSARRVLRAAIAYLLQAPLRVVTAGAELLLSIVAVMRRVALLVALALLPAVTSADSPNWFAGFELLNGHAAPGRGDRSALFDLGV